MKRIYWIDIAKLAAILAVIVDHTNGILYTNQLVAYSSYYSVSLFILVMGITTYWSIENKKISMKQRCIIKCTEILEPYLFATFLYCLYYYHSFDLMIFLKHIIHFNACGPFYYVLLYVQLIIISPVVYNLVKYQDNKKHEGLRGVVLVIGLLCIASNTTNYTNILDVYGGGGKLFGGTYLVLFCIGMWLGKIKDKFHFNKYIEMLGFIVCATMTIVWLLIIYKTHCYVDTLIPFGGGFNPPSICFSLYAILVLFTIYFTEKLCRNSCFKFMQSIYQKVSIIGKHTLYIFLYHKLILDILNNWYNSHISEMIWSNMWFKRILFLGVMITTSIAIEYITKSIHKFVKKAYE